MNRKIILLTLILFAFPNVNFSQKKKRVKASYYAHYFHGRTTANGEKFDMYAMTCAHKKLPFNTILKVRNLKNDRVVYVRVNDRGPYIKGRSIDLSYQAAKELDMIKYGVITVEYEIVKNKEDIENQKDNIEEVTNEIKRLYCNCDSLEKISIKTNQLYFKKQDKINSKNILLAEKVKTTIKSHKVKKEKESFFNILLNKIKELFD